MRTGLPWVWGATAAEVGRVYPSARFSPTGAERALRAVDVAADASTTWAWVCQLRRAPYSYDLVDNLGRRSPRDLDPAMLDVAVGDRIAVIFEVVDVVPGESITMQVAGRLQRRVFGPVVMTYAVTPAGPGASRLVGVLEMSPTRSVIGRPVRLLLVWGDLVMMRKQLRTLAALAATTPAEHGD